MQPGHHNADCADVIVFVITFSILSWSNKAVCLYFSKFDHLLQLICIQDYRSDNMDRVPPSVQPYGRLAGCSLS